MPLAIFDFHYNVIAGSIAFLCLLGRLVLVSPCLVVQNTIIISFGVTNFLFHNFDESSLKKIALVLRDPTERWICSASALRARVGHPWTGQPGGHGPREYTSER
jgi:hypothetical protein